MKVLDINLKCDVLYNNIKLRIWRYRIIGVQEFQEFSENLYVK